MASPTKINYGFSFTDYQINTPGEPLPGDEVDAAFNEVKRASDETIDRLNMIQRDDGELANQSVGVDQLKNDTFTVYQNYVSQAEAARDTAVSAAGSAETAKNAAEDARDVAISARNTATAAANTATSAKNDAENARDTATTAAGTATAAANTALNAKNDAEDARDTAAAAAGSATSAKNAAESARDTAVGAAGTATTAAGTATGAANAALNAKNDAEDARDTAVATVAKMSGGLSGQFLVKISNDDYDYGWANLPGGGDMMAAVYDPQGIGSDAFARANHTGTQAISTIDGLQNALDVKQDSAEKGAANGYAGLDSSGKVPTSQLPAAVLGSVSYQGPWNAATNTPAIPAASPANKGHYYVVTTAGSTTVDGENDWKVKDWIISDGASWSKVDNTESVISVAGKTGAITLSIGDIANLQNALDNKQASLNNQVSIELGVAVGSSQPTYIDFHTLDGPSDHSARIIRNVGANGSFGISNTGTGPIDLSASGGVTINGGTAWHSGNFNPASYVALTGTQQINGHKRFTSNLTGIGQPTGAGTMLEVFAGGGSPGAAGIAFHRSGVFAAYLGIDTDNRLKIGGWSMGTNAYEIWHHGRVNAAGWAVPTAPTENGHVATKQYVDGRTTISSQVQAEAGADNTTMMTPLRTAQAIAALSPEPPVGLYTGTNQNETIFPVGHMVLMNNSTEGINRNASNPVRISSDTTEYSVVGAGSALSGTWRSRGSTGETNLMQRTA